MLFKMEERHLEGATQGCCTRCPVAQLVKEVVEQAVGTLPPWLDIAINSSTVSVERSLFLVQDWALPKAVCEWIDCYDKTNPVMGPTMCLLAPFELPLDEMVRAVQLALELGPLDRRVIVSDGVVKVVSVST